MGSCSLERSPNRTRTEPRQLYLIFICFISLLPPMRRFASRTPPYCLQGRCVVKRLPSVGCMQCTRAGYKPNAFPNSVFARTSFLPTLTSIFYFSEFSMYLLGLGATVCAISFVPYRQHGVALHKHARDSTPRGACSRRVDFESAWSRTDWHPNASDSRHLSICVSQGRNPLLSAFCH
jgi:hypothetical protein